MNNSFYETLKSPITLLMYNVQLLIDGQVSCKGGIVNSCCEGDMCNSNFNFDLVSDHIVQTQ